MTAQTIPFLKSSEFQDGQPVGSITPTRMRDFIDTMDVRSFYSVKQYGAVGDNSTDDTVAIQSALNAAGSTGGVVVLPPATYACWNSAILTVPANVTLWGYGATLRSLNPQNFSDVQLNGVRSNIMGVHILSASTARNDGGNRMGIYLNGTTYSVVRDCTVEGVASASMFLQANGSTPTSYARILNNTVINGYDGIHTTGGSHHILVQGNHVINAGDDGLPVISYNTDPLGPCHDVQIIGNRVEGLTFAAGVDIHANNCIVMGNIIKNCFSDGVFIGTEEGLSYQNIDIIGNYIEHCQTGQVHDGNIFIEGGFTAGLTLTNINIIGNHIYNPNSVYGILTFGSAATSVNNLNISDNFISNVPDDGINIAGTTTTNLLISGNMLKTLGRHGINVGAGNVGASINGNQISAATTFGILNASVRASIVGNLVYDPSSLLTNGFSLAASTANCVVTGNNWGPKGQNLNSNTVITNG